MYSTICTMSKYYCYNECSLKRYEGGFATCMFVQQGTFALFKTRYYLKRFAVLFPIALHSITSATSCINNTRPSSTNFTADWLLVQI